MRDQRLWTWHVAAGLVVLVTLALHMAIMHLDALLGLFNPAGGHPIDWANVAARSRQGFFLVSYVVLLGAALFHGLYGLRTILHELGPGPALRRGVDVTLLAGGGVLFVFGAWAAWAAFAMARTV